MPSFGYENPMTDEQLDHYREVRKAREKQGLPVETKKTSWDRRLNEKHELHGKQFREVATGNILEVEVVGEYWRDGWYIDVILLVVGTNSHFRRTYKNISSENEMILERVEKFKDEFEEIK